MKSVRLRPTDYEREARAARDAAFAGEDGGRFFTAELPARAVLMPVSAPLSRRQFEALGRAAALVDDEETFYGWSLADGRGGWRLAFSDYDGYAAADDLDTFEYVLHSAAGCWALYWMWEWNAAAVGGAEPFLTELLGAWPTDAGAGEIVEPRRQAETFVYAVAAISKTVRRHEGARAWISSLLAHHYPEPEAERLLALFERESE